MPTALTMATTAGLPHCKTSPRRGTEQSCETITEARRRDVIAYDSRRWSSEDAHEVARQRLEHVQGRAVRVEAAPSSSGGYCQEASHSSAVGRSSASDPMWLRLWVFWRSFHKAATQTPATGLPKCGLTGMATVQLHCHCRGQLAHDSQPRHNTSATVT